MRKSTYSDMEEWNSPDQKPAYLKRLLIEHMGEFLSGYYDKSNEWCEYGCRKLDEKNITKWKYEKN